LRGIWRSRGGCLRGLSWTFFDIFGSASFSSFFTQLSKHPRRLHMLKLIRLLKPCNSTSSITLLLANQLDALRFRSYSSNTLKYRNSRSTPRPLSFFSLFFPFVCAHGLYALPTVSGPGLHCRYLLSIAFRGERKRTDTCI
jgi:hypothetical protein